MNEIKRFAVAGFPVAHSRSPDIFNMLFSLKDLKARYTRISTGSADDAFEVFRSLDLTAMNVTSPLKSDVLNFADETDDASEQIGGVNLLLNNSGLMKGYNTDPLGVSETLIQEKIDVKGRKCLVFGAGNAGRAAVYSLMAMGGDVMVVNRTYKKAHRLAGDMSCNSAVFDRLRQELGECDIFFSTVTSGTGMIKESWLRKDLVVFDANYLRSPVSDTARALGCRVLNGDKWLLNQAIPAFRIFTGKEIGKEETDRLRRLLKQNVSPVSKLILAGEDPKINDLKSKLEEKIEKIKIITTSDPEELKSEKDAAGPEERSFSIRIFSGPAAREKNFFPFSDLIIPGNGEPVNCAERILTEIGNVF